MCLKLEVFLPTVDKFLFLYPLKAGCVVILIWTFIRAVFCLLFFILSILELLVKQQLPCGFLLPKQGDLPSATIIALYLLYLIMVLAEAFLIIGCLLLARALIGEKLSFLAVYLIIRTLTWVAEVVCLIALCIIHKLIIGWYLGFLFFVILELYAWVVVYSYYSELDESKKVRDDEDCGT